MYAGFFKKISLLKNNTPKKKIDFNVSKWVFSPAKNANFNDTVKWILLVIESIKKTLSLFSFGRRNVN